MVKTILAAALAFTLALFAVAGLAQAQTYGPTTMTQNTTTPSTTGSTTTTTPSTTTTTPSGAPATGF